MSVTYDGYAIILTVEANAFETAQVREFLMCFQ